MGIGTCPAVNATSGSRCRRCRSCASMSTGALRVTRCTRALICSQNEAQAASSAANDSYSSSRFAPVGTRSALASFTVLSLPPLLAGSAGRHVLMLTE